jgi:hypothetical protein
MDSSQTAGLERRRRRRGVRVAIGLALAVLVALAVALITRDRIAESLARRWLGQHGVASKLKVRSLSLTGLSASLRLGDPSDPDFTVERMDVAYALSGPWNGKPFGVQTRSLRLVRPRLRLRLTGGHLNLGVLQPLIQEAAKHPPGGGPQPDVTVEDGVALLLTPDGHVRFRGGGALRGGALSALDGQVDPFVFTLFGAQVQGPGGGVHVARQGERLIASADFGPVEAMGDAGRLDAARITLSGALPYPTAAARWVGPMRLALMARGVSAAGAKVRAEGGTLSADLDGALVATAARQDFTGRLLATSQLASITSQASSADHATGELDLAHLALTHGRAGVSISGDGRVGLTAARAAAAGAVLSALTGSAKVQVLRIAARDGRTSASATLSGALAGRGAVSAASARRIAASVPILSSEPAYASAMQRGLRAFRFTAPQWRAEVSDRGARLALAAPLRVDADSGARLTVAVPSGALAFGPEGARGAVDLALDGGGLPALKVQASNASITRAGYKSDLAAQGALDALFARGAQVQLKGRLAGAGPRLRFDLAGCAPVSARRLAFDPNAVTDFSATLCPGAGPLIEAASNRWRTRGRLEHARGDVASFAADLREANGAFEAAGAAARLDTVGLMLDRGRLIDRTDPIRFRPLNAAGRMGLAHGAWNGGFAATTRAGHPIGAITIRHDVASGAGRAEIDAGALAFAPAGLQPAELTPLANFAREAEGPASFTGWFAWAPGREPTSGGELVAGSLKFKSPLGPVLGIDADLHFTSLSPLISAPSQRIKVGLVQALTPLSGLSAQFELGPQSISIEAASGGVASGHVRLEPLVASLASGSSIKGALVLDHVNVGEIIAASTLADTVKMDAVVDGRIPFELGPSGLTIQQGHLAAVGPGRISISRKALTGGSSVSAAPATPGAPGQAGFAQDLAYQAMENLAFDQLDASVNSLPGDRLGLLFHIKGRHDPPRPTRATIAIGDLIGGHPLDKPMNLPSDTKIDLTLDTSLNFGELIRALGQAWRDSMQDSGAPNRSAPVQGQGASVTTK